MSTYPKLVELYIDGKWQPGSTGQSLDILNPVNNSVIGQVAKASIADLDKALAAADRAFKTWKEVPPIQRAQYLIKAAQLLRERVDQIAPLLSQEMGKPYDQSVAEIVGMVPGDFDWFAGEATRMYGRVIPSRTPGGLQFVTKEPVGVVAAFTPWNSPMYMMGRKVGPALIAGCTVVLKAAEETPASCAALMQVLHDVGVPPGVVNLVYGDPNEISNHLIPNPIIRKISFTGSVPVGKHLAAMAGQYMKRSTMELGGHGPVIVAEDADLQGTANAMAGFKYMNAGQICVSPTRFLVQEKVYDDFVGKFVERAKAVKVGDPMDRSVQMGPVVSERRLVQIEELVADAVSKGAQTPAGGRRIGNEGNFFEPTVLTGLNKDMRIMNEEPFGPLALMIPYKTLDDAIEEANRLPYGLGAYAFTANAKSIQRIIKEVEAGMVRVNGGGGGTETPFGGVRDSGVGSDGGPEAIEAYQVWKFVAQGAI